MSTLTIRNLGAGVKDRLRLRAAKNHRSMEAEVRAILARAVEDIGDENLAAQQRVRENLPTLNGLWGKGMTTDELMRELRE